MQFGGCFVFHRCIYYKTIYHFDSLKSMAIRNQTVRWIAKKSRHAHRNKTQSLNAEDINSNVRMFSVSHFTKLV